MNVVSSPHLPALSAPGSSPGGLAGLTGGKQETFFLQLLLSQVKNQDPLNPTDTSQFVSQLTQFSQLEQLIAIRSAMDTLTNSPAQTANEKEV